MQLQEVKGNISRIVYNPAGNHLLPSDFLLIEDSNQKLIAQIINISTTEDSNNNIADVRLILSIDKNDNLSYYNGYIPLKTSSVVYIHPDEIIELIKNPDDNIYLGNLSNHNECFVKVPMSCLNDRLYIQSDRYDTVKTIIQNIVAELISQKNKVIIFDFNGNYSSASNIPRLKIAESFKLPLNIEAFNNILEYDTTDCPIEDKVVIQSIVLELREYIKTIDNKFLPFTLFKTVIDKELETNPISGLKLLRNKLWLYAQEGIFAESKTQFELLNNILENQNVVIIDASSLEDKWYKFAIQTIQELVKQNCYLIMSLNDIEADKKTITNLYNKPNIIPIVSTSYDSKYRQTLKSICKNQILFKPSKVINDEEVYSYYINRINSTEFIVYGESELYIPLILELQSFNASTPNEVTENEIKKDVDKLFTLQKNNYSKPKNVIETESIQTMPSSEDIIRPMSVSDDIVRPMSVSGNDEVYIEPKKDINQNIDDDFNDEDLDFLDEQNEEKITIDDIRKPKDTVEEKKYDVFSPINSIDEEIQEENEDELTVLSENEEDDIENLSEIEEDEEIQSLETEAEEISDITNIDEETNDSEVIEDIEEIKDTEETAQPLEEEANNDILDEISDNEELIQETEEKEEENLQDAQDILDELNEEPSTEELPDETTNEDKTEDDTLEELIEDNKEEKIEDDDNKDMTSIDDIINDIEEKADNANASEVQASDTIIQEKKEYESKPTETEAPPINENIKEKKSTNLPYYQAVDDYDSMPDKVPYQIGDKVHHPKLGNGVIVDFMHFGDKIQFCRVDFEDKGIRLLDPRISSFEKID